MKYFSSRSTPGSRRKTSGFTLIEVMIAIAVGVIFIAGVGRVVLPQITGARISVAENFFIQDARTGVVRYVSRKGDSAGLKKSWLTGNAGLNTNTAWGDTWTLDPDPVTSTELVSFKYPASSNDICAELATALIKSKYDFLNADSTCSGKDLTVVIKAL